MKRGFALIELLIVVAIIGILAALLIPAIVTSQQKSKSSSYMQTIMKSIVEYEEEISAGDYSEKEKKAFLSFLDKLHSEISSYGQVKSMEELRIKIAFLEDKIRLLEQPDKWKQMALAEPEKREYEDIRTRLAILEMRTSSLAEERITKWDVALIVFTILAGMGTLVAVFKYLVPSKENRSIQPAFRRKRQNDKEDNLS